MLLVNITNFYLFFYFNCSYNVKSLTLCFYQQNFIRVNKHMKKSSSKIRGFENKGKLKRYQKVLPKL